jgi:hypothetical protein
MSGDDLIVSDKLKMGFYGLKMDLCVKEWSFKQLELACKISKSW